MFEEKMRLNWIQCFHKTTTTTTSTDKLQNTTKLDKNMLIFKPVPSEVEVLPQTEKATEL